MKTAYYIGMDIAKLNFQVHGADKSGKQLYNKKIKRHTVLDFFANIPKCIVGIEACGGAHYWAREISKFGHNVHLISPRLVKPFVINNKTDAADAMAICEVLRRPSTKFVAVKTEEQQAIVAIHKARERVVKNRTALANQIRGVLYEVGIIIPQGITHIRKHLSAIIGDLLENPRLHELLLDFYEEFIENDKRVISFNKRLSQIANEHVDCKRLMDIPGIGVLTATLLVAHVGKAHSYKNGRQFAASLGLTPREHSSGGKQKLLGITKKGNCHIRKLLIQGALIVGRYAMSPKNEGNLQAKWYRDLIMRRNKFIAAVAQANKTARIIWVVLARNEEYNAKIG